MLKIILILIITLSVYANNNLKTYKIHNKDIEITIVYPKHIVQGDKIRLAGVMKNRYRNAKMGGLTISFPQFKYTKGSYSDNTFDTINSYSPPDKIYSGIHKKNIRSKYYMIEGWENNWKKRLEKHFYIEVDIPKYIDQLTINVRGVLVFGKSKKYRTEIKLPLKSHTTDQQGYPVGQLNIPIYKNIQPPNQRKSTITPVKKKETTTGTGFFINSNDIITNQHVVNSCQNITIKQDGFTSSATIKSVDNANDLAILTIKEPHNTHLKFRSGRSARIGESIIAMGYPLGILLGSSVKLTTGNISSLTGLMNDTTTLQLTAPVQPGNSGGPLLDNTGNVVGVVYAKLKNEVAQNVNLAIKANIVKMFLDAHDTEYYIDTNKTKKEIVDIADIAKKSIIQIICKP